MRLDKFLADCGVGTRSELKKRIRGGGITVDGKPVCKPETAVSPETSVVTVDGREVRYRKFIYLMLHKPAGYLSATWDRKQPTVLDLVPEEYLHFQPFPVGRLDIDTEGLCFLTNDGGLAHRLLSPVWHVPKTYFAKVSLPLAEEAKERFREGIVLPDGTKTKPAQLEMVSKTEALITIYEGKFHQVKRMVQAVGSEVTYLKRLTMGPLRLEDTLPVGAVRELTEAEQKDLFEAVTRKEEDHDSQD